MATAPSTNPNPRQTPRAAPDPGAPQPGRAGSAPRSESPPAPESRTGSLIEVLHFGPTNPRRSLIADYSAAFLATLMTRPELSAKPVLDYRVIEDLGSHEAAAGWVKQWIAAAMRDRGPVHDQVLHAEIGRTTHREFWAARHAARLRPASPLCLVFHDPPHLPSGVPAPDTRKRPGLFESLITPFSAAISAAAQRRMQSSFLSRASVFLSPSRRGADLLAYQYPSHRRKIGHIPPWMIGRCPPVLEPNQRRENEIVQFGLLGFSGAQDDFMSFIEGILLANRQRRVARRLTLKVRGPMPAGSVTNELLEGIGARLHEHGVRNFLDVKIGLMGPAEEERFLRETDVMVFPYGEGQCDGANIPFMRAQGWAAAVLAADAGSFREIVRDGVDGVLYPTGNVTVLANIICRLVEDAPWRMTLAKAMRDRASRERSARDMASLMLEIYRAMLQARDEKRPVVLPEAARIE
jgi:glycosyltransferase involved in cell wall biosynthesis